MLNLEPALPYFNRSLGAGLLGALVDFRPSVLSSQTALGNRSEAAKRGLRYERKVLGSLRARYGARFAPQPSFSFKTNSKQGRAIPDGLLFSGDGKSVLIIEIKLAHCADAWHQLTKFYLPIVSEALRGLFTVRCVEICKTFDPWVKLPLEARPLASLDDVYDASKDILPVLITRDGSF